MKKYFLFFFISLFSSFVLSAQSTEDFALIKKCYPIEQSKTFYKNSRNNKNEFEIIFSGLFLFYKGVFSSQDVPGTCNFTPSCSEYGLLSVKKKGIVFGVLNTFDRLTRCNGMSSGFYMIDEQTGKFIDNP